MKHKIRNPIKLKIHLLLMIVFLKEQCHSHNLTEDVDSSFLHLYFQNNRLVDFQSKCLFEDSPCDIIGRWMKPRIAAALLGSKCHPCSIDQSETLLTIIARLKKTRPDFYERALITYLNNRQLLDLLATEYGVSRTPAKNIQQPPMHSLAPTVLPATPHILTDAEELLKVAESSVERRHIEAPNIDENFIPGKVSRTFVDTSLIDIFITPRSSQSFTIPILTKSFI